MNMTKKGTVKSDMPREKDENRNEVVKYLESMPQCKKDMFAAATLELFNKIQSTPEGRARLIRKKAQLKAEGII